MNKEERVLITGCGGMLGEALFKACSGGFTNILATDIDLNESWLGHLDVRDINECEKIFKSFKPTLVFHLAALTDLEYCQKHFEEAWGTNALGTENIALLCEKNSATMVYISTAGVFDGLKEVYTDFDTPMPINYYGASKYYGEKFVGQHVSKHFIFRAGWMMGGGMKKDKKFIKKIFDQINAGTKELFVVDDKAGTPTYTHDFSKNMLEVIPTSYYGLYNQVCGGETDRLEIAEEFVKILGLSDEIKVNPVSSDYFNQEYFAPRPKSEILLDLKLNLRQMNNMRDWKTCLMEYGEIFKEEIKRGRKKMGGFETEMEKMPDEILVSICIPAYNAENLIPRALQSCISQTYSNIEIVITDDSINDEMEKIVREFVLKDPRIKYFKNHKRFGASANFLEAYRHANGEFIQHLDQDDWLDEDYIEKKLDIFKKYPEVAFVSGSILTYRPNLSGGVKLMHSTKKDEGFYSANYIYKNFIRNIGLIGHACMARRQDMIDNCTVTVPNSYGYEEYYNKAKVVDGLIYLRILTHYKNMYYLKDVSYNALLHKENTSASFGLEAATLEDHIKSTHVDVVGFGWFFDKYKSEYSSGFKIYMGGNIIASAFIDKITRRASGPFFGNLKIFFKDYTWWEETASILTFPARLVTRSFQKIFRKDDAK